MVGRVGHVFSFLVGVAVGAGLVWWVAPRRTAFWPMAAGDRTSNQPAEVPVASVNVDSSAGALIDLNRSAACPVQPMIMSATARDVRLELRSAVGGLLEGTSLDAELLGSSDEDVFLAAWEKHAAKDGPGHCTAVGDSNHGSTQPPGDLAPSGGDPGDPPAERATAK